MPSETSPSSETALAPKPLGDAVTYTQPKSLVLPETGSSASVSRRPPLQACLPSPCSWMGMASIFLLPILMSLPITH